MNYANFGQRFLAVLIDAILVGIVSSLFTGGYGRGGGEFYFGTTGLLPTLLAWAYYVFMTSKYGATLGKMAMKIRVQHETTGANLTYVEAFLREVVGKLLSTVALLLGYLWMLWDPKNQTWHDKLAKSVVVKAE